MSVGICQNENSYSLRISNHALSQFISKGSWNGLHRRDRSAEPLDQNQCPGEPDQICRDKAWNKGESIHQKVEGKDEHQGGDHKRERGKDQLLGGLNPVFCVGENKSEGSDDGGGNEDTPIFWINITGEPGYPDDNPAADQELEGGVIKISQHQISREIMGNPDNKDGGSGIPPLPTPPSLEPSHPALILIVSVASENKGVWAVSTRSLLSLSVVPDVVLRKFTP